MDPQQGGPTGGGGGFLGVALAALAAVISVWQRKKIRRLVIRAPALPPGSNPASASFLARWWAKSLPLIDHFTPSPILQTPSYPYSPTNPFLGPPPATPAALEALELPQLPAPQGQLELQPPQGYPQLPAPPRVPEPRGPSSPPRLPVLLEEPEPEDQVGQPPNGRLALQPPPGRLAHRATCPRG